MRGHREQRGAGQGKAEHDKVYCDDREHVTRGGTPHAHTDEGGGAGQERGRRRGRGRGRGRGQREINRVAIPPSSRSEAELLSPQISQLIPAARGRAALSSLLYSHQDRLKFSLGGRLAGE